MNAATDRTPLAIACSLTEAERVQRGQDFDALLQDAEKARELPEGYALKFPNRDAWITRAVELIVAERKCCPFFGFALVFEPNGGPVWLHVCGPEIVKEDIRERMLPAHLRAGSA